MATQAPQIQASKRDQLSSRANKRLRDAGHLPGVVYGHKEAIIPVTLPKKEVVNHLNKGAHLFDLTLDGTSAYEQAFDVAGARAGTEVFVDIGTVGGLLGLVAELPDDARDILSGLGAFALTIPTEPDQIEFRAVLTVE